MEETGCDVLECDPEVVGLGFVSEIRGPMRLAGTLRDAEKR